LQAAKAVAERLHGAGAAIAQLEQAAEVEINPAAAGQPAKEAAALGTALVPIQVDDQFIEAGAFLLQ
jgi:hypothetical protein